MRTKENEIPVNLLCLFSHFSSIPWAPLPPKKKSPATRNLELTVLWLIGERPWLRKNTLETKRPLFLVFRAAESRISSTVLPRASGVYAGNDAESAAVWGEIAAEPQLSLEHGLEPAGQTFESKGRQLGGTQIGVQAVFMGEVSWMYADCWPLCERSSAPGGRNWCGEIAVCYSQTTSFLFQLVGIGVCIVIKGRGHLFLILNWNCP